MTKVTIVNQKPKKEVKHKVGNFYQCDDDVYILANVAGDVGLISLTTGSFYTAFVRVNGNLNDVIPAHIFTVISSNNNSAFKLIENVEIYTK